MDIEDAAGIASSTGCILEVILKIACLSYGQKSMACRVARQASANCVKTSTEFGPSAVTELDLRLMLETYERSTGVRAMGGARTLEGTMRMPISRPERLGGGVSSILMEPCSHMD